MLIRKIELGLENCDVITIDGKYIGAFYAGDIRKQIARMACNYVDIAEICHEFYLEVHKDANKKHFELGCEEFETTVFERLQMHNDICSITVYLYDECNNETCDDESKDTVYHYLLSWGGDSDYVNAYQYSKVSKEGWLYIVVGEKMDINEVFPNEECDDEEMMDSYAAMLDIGDKYYAEHEDLMRNAKKNPKPTTRTIKVTVVYNLDDPEVKDGPITPKMDVEKMVMREMKELFSEGEGFVGIAVTVTDE